VGARAEQGGTRGCCPLAATWAEVVDDGAALLTGGGRGPLVACGLAEGLRFRGHPLWGVAGCCGRGRGPAQRRGGDGGSACSSP